MHFDQHIKKSLGAVGEFYTPQGQRQYSSNGDRDTKKNEERTATGIVIGRNLDPTGTLEIYNIDSGTKVNRCRIKLLRQPSTDNDPDMPSVRSTEDIITAAPTEAIEKDGQSTVDNDTEDGEPKNRSEDDATVSHDNDKALTILLVRTKLSH